MSRLLGKTNTVKSEPHKGSPLNPLAWLKTFERARAARQRPSEPVGKQAEYSELVHRLVASEKLTDGEIVRLEEAAAALGATADDVARDVELLGQYIRMKEKHSKFDVNATIAASKAASDRITKARDEMAAARQEYLQNQAWLQAAAMVPNELNHVRRELWRIFGTPADAAALEREASMRFAGPPADRPLIGFPAPAGMVR